MTADELQNLLRFITVENNFFEFDQAAVEGAIKEQQAAFNKAQREQAKPGQGIEVRLLPVDMATPTVTVQLGEKKKTVGCYGYGLYAQWYGESIKPLKQIVAVEHKYSGSRAEIGVALAMTQAVLGEAELGPAWENIAGRNGSGPCFPHRREVAVVARGCYDDPRGHAAVRAGEAKGSGWGKWLMPIAFQCASCGQSYSAPDSAAGRQIRCKKCASPLSVPQAAKPGRPESAPVQSELARLLDEELSAPPPHTSQQPVVPVAESPTSNQRTFIAPPEPTAEPKRSRRRRDWVPSPAIEQLQLGLAVTGGVVTIIGLFCPLITLQIAGNSSYFNFFLHHLRHLNLDNWIFIAATLTAGLAIVTIGLARNPHFDVMWLTGLGILICTGVTLNDFQQLNTQLQKGNIDHHVKLLAALLAFDIRWGFSVLFLGGGLIVASAGLYRIARLVSQ